MELLETVLVAIALAMDCLAVSISCGLAHGNASSRDSARIGLFFGGFQAGMAFLGWLGGTGFRDLFEDYAHWIAFFLLLIIGGRMLLKGLKNGADCKLTDFRNNKVIVLLSVATSIDALAVGVTYAFLEVQVALPLALIGLVSFAFAYLGLHAGCKLGERFEGRVELLGGLILLAIGFKILIEGLFLEGVLIETVKNNAPFSSL